MTPEELCEALKAKGFHLTYVVVNPGGLDEAAEFDVTISRNNLAFTTKYSKGWGHRQWRKAILPSGTMTGYWDKYRKPGHKVKLWWGFSELKKPEKMNPSQNRDHQQRLFDEFAKLTEAIPPTLDEVVWSLVSDANSVRYGQTFEDFCGEFGYNTDSRSAERTYNACRDIWSALVRLGADLDELMEMFQDY